MARMSGSPLSKKITQRLATLPKKPGCYLFRDSGGTVLYVGKAKVLRNRVRSYFHTTPNFAPAKFSMMRQVADIETIVVSSEMEALILESILIKKYEPRYNVVLKDDKHYLFIKVTVQEDFPQVETVRRVAKDGARYFGPFTNSFAVRDTLRLLQRIFPYRTCDLDLQVSASPGSKAAPAGTIKARGYRPCLRYHMGRCDAPCIENISREDYRAVIDKVLLFLEGKLDFVMQDLRREMERAAAAHLFERAARLRDQIKQIEHLTAKQVVLSPRFTNQDVLGVVTDRERNRAFAALMLIRDGKVLGQEHFVVTLAAGATDEEVLRRLIVEHYEQATFIPKQLILGTKLSDQVALTQLLRTRTQALELKHAPQIVVPRAGLNKRLLAMAEENAQEFRARKTHEWAAADLNVQAALAGLAKALTPPLKKKAAIGTGSANAGLDRVEIYDISNIQGTSAVGSMVVFDKGRPNKQAYRRFKIARTLAGRTQRRRHAQRSPKTSPTSLSDQ
ncbi:MAG: excinuclease ABC subunit UvrC [Candidatus Andersenbacteria bacterium]